MRLGQGALSAFPQPSEHHFQVCALLDVGILWALDGRVSLPWESSPHLLSSDRAAYT